MDRRLGQSSYHKVFRTQWSSEFTEWGSEAVEWAVFTEEHQT